MPDDLDKNINYQKDYMNGPKPKPLRKILAVCTYVDSNY